MNPWKVKKYPSLHTAGKYSSVAPQSCNAWIYGERLWLPCAALLSTGIIWGSTEKCTRVLILYLLVIPFSSPASESCLLQPRTIPIPVRKVLWDNCPALQDRKRKSQRMGDQQLWRFNVFDLVQELRGNITESTEESKQVSVLKPLWLNRQGYWLQ